MEKRSLNKIEHSGVSPYPRDYPKDIAVLEGAFWNRQANRSVVVGPICKNDLFQSRAILYAAVFYK